MKRILWVGGWGVPPEWLANEFQQAIPACRHEVLPPSPAILSREFPESADLFGGFSLGAFLLLLLNQKKPLPRPAVLLAPFFAYPAEAGLGGKVRTAQIRFLSRWLRRDRLSALQDFYDRAGLPVPKNLNILPCDEEILQWGLSILEQESTPPPIPSEWRAVCGKEDRLLDAATLNRIDPSIHIVPGAGHEPVRLLAALQGEKIFREQHGSQNENKPQTEPGNPVSSFERAAAHYDRFSRVQQEMAKWTAEWLPDDESAGRIREVAAGTGHLSARLLSRNNPAGAIVTDASPAMVAEGRKRLPGIRWEIRNADDIPDPPADWILSSSFLQWESEPARLFARWREALAPNGRILGGLFVHPTLPELHAIHPGITPVAWRTLDEWRQFLKKAGLSLLRDEADTRSLWFPSALELFRSLHYVGAAPHRVLSAGELKRLLNVYQQKFSAGSGVASTWTFYRFEAIRPA